MRDYFSPEWAEYAFGVLFTVTWQACILVGVAAAASACVRRVRFRSAVWSACMVGLVLVPVCTIVFPHFYVVGGSQPEPLHYPSHIARPTGAAAHSVWTLSDDWWDDRVCRALLYVWAAGAAVALGRLTLGWRAMAGLLRHARPCRDPRVSEIVNQLVGRPNVIRVLEMDGLVGAICWQVHRPMIILPGDSTQLSDREVEMMIHHELAHLRRGDPSVLFIQRLVEVLYWFHPLVWWAALQASRDREFVCDDHVLEAGFASAEYAKCLGQLATWYYAPLPLAPAGLGMLWAQHLVLRRVRRLIQGTAVAPACTELRRPARAATALAAVLVMALVGLVRVDPSGPAGDLGVRWTAWPEWSAGALDALGFQVRDFPLDAHRYDVREPRESVAE